MDARPIGVFDSGLGGLTAVRSLRQILPEENLIYFGETARVPYGGRSKETLRRENYQREICMAAMAEFHKTGKGTVFME